MNARDGWIKENARSPGSGVIVEELPRKNRINYGKQIYHERCEGAFCNVNKDSF